MTAPRKQPALTPFDRAWASQFRLQCGDKIWHEDEAYSGWYRVVRINRYDYVLNPCDCNAHTAVLANRLQLHLTIRDENMGFRDSRNAKLHLNQRLAEPLRIL